MPRRVYEDEGLRYVVYRGETRDAPGCAVGRRGWGNHLTARAGLEIIYFFPQVVQTIPC